MSGYGVVLGLARYLLIHTVRCSQLRGYSVEETRMLTYENRR